MRRAWPAFGNRILSAVVALCLASCGGGGSGGGAAPPPPPPPEPAPPTVSIVPNVTAVAYGEEVLLRLTAANVSTCTLTSTAPGSEPLFTQGTLLDPLPRRIFAETTFTYACTGTATGASVTQSVTITVTTPALTITSWDGDVRDIAWDAARRVMYVALGSASRLAPNSVVALDPATGSIVGSAYAGSEPSTLSLSSDGASLHVGYGGATLVSRFALPGLVRDEEFPIPLHAGGGYAGSPEVAVEVSAAPDSTDLFAVSVFLRNVNPPDAVRRFIAYRGQTPLAGAAGSETFPGIRSLGTYFAWSGPETLFAIRDFGPRTVLERFDMSGSTVINTGELELANNTIPGHIQQAGGRIYTNCGLVLDAATMQALQPFPRSCSSLDITASVEALVDLPGNRAYFVERTDSSLGWKLDVYEHDSRTLLYTGRLPYGSKLGRLVRFGTDGLAITTNRGVLLLLNGPFIMPGVAPATSVLPSEPASPAQWWTRIPYSILYPKVQDIAWDQRGLKLYALLAADAPDHAGQIAVLDYGDWTHPSYISRPVPITAMDVADDGRYLYVAVSDAVERLSLPTLERDFTWTNINDAYLVRAAPGAPDTIVINGLVYDGGTVRSGYNGLQPLWGATADRLYFLNTENTGFQLDAYDMSGGGMRPQMHYSVYAALHPFPFYSKYSRFGGLLVSDTGIAFDPERGIVPGMFMHSVASGYAYIPGPFDGGFVTPAWGPSVMDEAQNRAYFLECEGVTNDDLCTTRFLSYDTRTFSVVDKWVLDDMRGRARKLIRVNGKDLAAITYDRRAILITEPERAGGP